MPGQVITIAKKPPFQRMENKEIGQTLMKVKFVEQASGVKLATVLFVELIYTGTDLPQPVLPLEPETIPQTVTTLFTTVPINQLIRVTPALAMGRIVVVGVVMQIILRMGQVVFYLLPSLI